MKLTENPDEIVIRHAPVGQWILGGILTFIFAIFCLWLLFNLRGFFASGISDALILAFIIACILIPIVGIKLASMICAPIVTLTVSQKTKSVDIASRRFYGSQTKRFYFTQIKKFKSYKPKIKFSSEYFLALVLANQKTLKLKTPIGDDKQNTIKLVKKLNKFVKSRQAAAKENIKSQSI